MKFLPACFVLAALASSLAWSAPAGAQGSAAGSRATFAQTERNAVGLKQGMSAEEVQKLLGAPRRTTLRSNGSSTSSSTSPSTNAAPQGTLQWTYAGTDTSQGSLRIEFTPKAPAQWVVTSWDWVSY